MHLETMRRIYEKNRSLLDDLPEDDRIMIEKTLFDKFRTLALSAACEEAERSNKKRAFSYLLYALRHSNPRSFNWRLAVRTLLPKRAYEQLRAVYHVFRPVRR